MAVKTFTTGEVLTAADTNTYLNNGGLVYITSASFSAVASVSVNSCFTSTYENYLLQVRVYGSASSNVALRFRIGGVDDTTALYFDRGYYNNAGTVTALTNSSATSIFLGNYANNASYPGRHTARVLGPQDAARTVVHTQWEDSSTALGGDTHSFMGTVTQYDGFTLLPASGTITGKYWVYGERQP